MDNTQLTELTDETVSGPTFTKSKETSCLSRGERRKEVYVNSFVCTSFQERCNEGVHTYLNYMLTQERSDQFKSKFIGLRRIHDYLTKSNGWMTMANAIETFNGFQEKPRDTYEVRDLMLHPEYGLNIHVVSLPNLTVNKQYIILKSDCNLPSFIEEVLNSMKKESNPVSKDLLHSIFQSMDTEWDRSCLKLVLKQIYSNEQLEKLCVWIQNEAQVDTIKENLIEVENTRVAAEDLVHLRLHDKETRLDGEIETLQSLIRMKTGKWSATKMADLKEKLQTKQESLEEVKKMEDPFTPYDRQRYNQMVQRQQNGLMESNRLKRRAITTQGRPESLNSDDEEFIAKQIEDKTTIHGRRHELTMYTNRRVKKEDLLNIANYRLLQEGRKIIKSATTVYNRSRPRNIKSRQAKLHRGKGLFCSKKPPKAEDLDNENTHYQRAHVKHLKMALFSADSQKFSIAESIDDKCYLRPGTSEGFRNTKAGSILTLTDSTKARKLPKYDWPEKLVYVTPGTHRVFKKELDSATGNLITVQDDHFVYVRPKAFVGSSGSVWASESLELVESNPMSFSVEGTGDPDMPSKVVTFGRKTNHLLKQYIDMTMAEDIAKVKPDASCQHRQYECKRAKHLCSRLHAAFDDFEEHAQLSIYNIKVVNDVVSHIEATVAKSHTAEVEISRGSCQVPALVEELSSLCVAACNSIESLQLPVVKPRKLDLTDAGPGVGVSNIEVRYRDAELARIQSSDYRARIHRSRGDSGQNEAERTNAAIGDAIVDGATLPWEKHKVFDNMNEDHIQNLSVQEYERLQFQAMEKNAWDVSKEVVNRIDDAPVMREHIRAYLTKPLDEHFFFNQKELHMFHNSSSPEGKAQIPGAAYLKKITDFVSIHYTIGELFMEYKKQSCLQSTGEMCDFCQENPWLGPSAERVPQPMPDPDNPMHYLPLEKTPRTVNEEPRQVDDCLPRACIIRLVNEGVLCLDDATSIDEVAKSLAVEPCYVRHYMEHIQHLQRMKGIRSGDRKTKKQSKLEKKVEDYDWFSLVRNNDINKLLVVELDKYLDLHSLVKLGNKQDKIQAISVDVWKRESEQGEAVTVSAESDGGESDDEISDSDDTDSDEDLVCAEMGDSDIEVEAAEESVRVPVSTRCGRQATRLASYK
jgi:hypothetical protein